VIAALFVFASFASSAFAQSEDIAEHLLEKKNQESAQTIPASETVPPTATATQTAEQTLPSRARKYTVAFTTAIAVPQPLTLGVQVQREGDPDLAVFYEAGFFKYPLTDATRSVSDYSMVAGVRYHPFHNWFYTSAEFGYRHIGVSVDISNLKQDGVALANSATLSLGTVFAGLLVGGEWKLSQNIGVALDLGMQIALLHTGGIEIHSDPTQDADPNDLTVDDSAEMGRISGLPLPQIAIFRFIWYI
jgi:hypothetical protein